MESLHAARWRSCKRCETWGDSMTGFEILDAERDLSHGVDVEKRAWQLLEEVTRLREERYRAIAELLRPDNEVTTCDAH